MVKVIDHCEVCGNTLLSQGLDLGSQPLPDDLKPIGSAEVCSKYPLMVVFCDECKTAHQKFQVEKEKLFHPAYHYRAAQTQDVLHGMEQFVQSVATKMPLHGAKVCDIGCNDGSLLDAFKRYGALTTGIEPTDAVQEAAKKGHGIIQAFFNIETAQAYLRSYGSPDLITFTNVFAHIEDLPHLLSAIYCLLKPTTKIVIENHYLGSVLDRHQFDTFYQEHPRTYSYTSFSCIASALAMHIADVEFPSRYGGNIRVFLERGNRDFLDTILQSENNFGERLKQLGQQVNKWRIAKREAVLEEYAKYGMIAGIAFPARASVLINSLGMTNKIIDAVYEKTGSKKIGCYVPGTHIPIKDDADFPFFTYPKSGSILNFAWHIPHEIANRWFAHGYSGRIIQAVEESDFR